MEGVFSFFLESTFLGLFLFGEKRPGARRATGSRRCMVFLGSWLSGYLHHRHRRLDAAPGRATKSCRAGPSPSNSFWALLFNPWAGWQYAAQHDRCRGHRLLRDGGGRRVLPAHAAARRATANALSECGGDGGGDLLDRTALSDRRRPGKDAGQASAGHPGGHGRPLSHRGGRADGHHRTARHGASASGQSDRGPADAELSDLPAVEGGGERARRVPEDGLAGQHSAALLRYHIMVGLGTFFIAICLRRGASALAGRPPHRALDALDSHAELPVPLHRQHRGLDHGRGRPPAMAHLRADAHRRRILQERLGGERPLHADRIHGDVHRARNSLSVPRPARDRPGPVPAPRAPRRGSAAAPAGG